MSVHPLCTARESKDLSMRELSSLLELGEYGHRRIFGWEHGETIPTYLYAKALAKALGFESGEQVQILCREWREKRQRGESHAN